MLRLILLISCLLLVLPSLSCSTNRPPCTPLQTPPSPIKNLHALTPTLYSGDEPATAQHYTQLARLGIRTVISVDAIAPDPELADPHAIRIVHLPIGYDGIDPERAAELAAAIDTLEHPIYLHCHHGKHRGPAALCVGAIGAGLITNDQATDFMNLAGTSENYPGLWDAARTSEPLDPSILHSITDFPSRAPVPGFVEGMGQLDRLHERLWDLAENNWQTPESHPDLSPTAVSGQLHDHLRAMLDLEFFRKRGSMMRSRFESITETARLIESRIIARDYDEARIALGAMSQSCLDCHERFRN